jgi:phage terminase large subunit-like protein
MEHAGAWVTAVARVDPGVRIAIVGSTTFETRAAVQRALLSRAPAGEDKRIPRYIATQRCLVFPNGARAFLYSNNDPWGLRGMEFRAAWVHNFDAVDGETIGKLLSQLRGGPRPSLLATRRGPGGDEWTLLDFGPEGRP